MYSHVWLHKYALNHSFYLIYLLPLRFIKTDEEYNVEYNKDNTSLKLHKNEKYTKFFKRTFDRDFLLPAEKKCPLYESGVK